MRDMAEVDIEEPIIEVIDSLNKLPFCFTIQSCFGHFLFENKPASTTYYLPEKTTRTRNCKYRISYVAIRVDGSQEARGLLSLLRDIPSTINKEYIQFGCAEWFWEQHINSFVIQVQPRDRSNVDSLLVTTEEAQLIQAVRDRFWEVMESTL